MKDLKEFIEKFKNFVNTAEGKEWKKEREDRKRFYSKLMSKDHINNLTEDEFREVIKSLWASNFWTNKDWKVNRILEENRGIERIREELSNLLYGEGSVEERYDNFRRRIKGLGASMLTELMAFVASQKYCIWNDKPKAVLRFLEMDNLLPNRVFKYQISGKDYKRCIDVLGKIKNELEAIIPNPDFIDVDFFLAFIFYKILPTVEPLPETPSEEKKKPTEVQPISEISDHTTAQRALVELGNLLGFDTYLPPEDRNKIDIATLRDIPPFTYPHLLNTVKHIDVIWFKEEFPVYCFEVEESTDVTKGLLRLYQIRKLKVVPIIVGPENKRSKFKREVEKEPFRSIKNKYKFISYEELSELLKVSKQFSELKRKLLGESV